MNNINSTLVRACQFAAAMIAREVATRRRFNHDFNPDEVWASVTRDAKIHIGTPLLYPGEGYYVNHSGDRWEV